MFEGSASAAVRNGLAIIVVPSKFNCMSFNARGLGSLPLAVMKVMSRSVLWRRILNLTAVLDSLFNNIAL